MCRKPLSPHLNRRIELGITDPVVERDLSNPLSAPHRRSFETRRRSFRPRGQAIPTNRPIDSDKLWLLAILVDRIPVLRHF